MSYHVTPNNDGSLHRMGGECWCNPRLEYRDSDGVFFPGGPISIHSSADGRELLEESTGDQLRPDKTWTVWHWDGINATGV